jgi:hypothetical protein
MPIESIAALVILCLVGLLFAKTVEFTVKLARRMFVGKETDVIGLLRVEVKDLHLEVDEIWKKLGDLKIQNNKIKAKLESLAVMPENVMTLPLSIVPASPTTSPGLEDTWERVDSKCQVEQRELVTTTIEQSTSADSWTRDTGIYRSFNAANDQHGSERAEKVEGESRPTFQAYKGHSRQATLNGDELPISPLLSKADIWPHDWKG